MRFPLLRCLAKAVVKHGLKFLCNLVPGGGPVYDIAADVVEEYLRDCREEDLRADLQSLAQAPAEPIHQEVAAAVQAEAAAQPPEIQQALTAYLTQVPAAIRRSLRRSSDPTGTTVPATLALSRPEDLMPFLPSRPPRFRPGDRPLPGVDWVLKELVGVGGFGEVWKAVQEHKHDEPPRAFKFCCDQAAVPALRNELGLLLRVRQHGTHPGIVRLIDTHLSADPPFLEYEFVEGGDLAGLIQDLHEHGRMTLDLANRLFLHLVEIVAHVHRADPPIVHGDLKPANVLVRRGTDGKIGLRVTDFGIGGVAAAQAARESRQPSRSRHELLTEAVRGAYTPLYASPEQMTRRKGERADPCDDVHALGVIWYQLLTGDLGMMSMPPDWREQVEERGLDAELVKLLASCIAPKAAKRPASAIALAEQLQAALPQPPKDEAAVQKIEPAKPRQRHEAKARPQKPDDLAGQLEGTLRAVEQAHAEAQQLVRERHDYAAAVQTLERVPEHLRDTSLHASLCEKRDRAAQLEEEITQAVRETRLTGLRSKVAALLELKPQREDLRRLMKRLPKEPRPGEIVTISVGQVKKGGFLGLGAASVDVSMQFAWCPPGTFLMGSPSSEESRSEDETQHRVTLTRGFHLGIHAVTQAQWQAVMGDNPSRFKDHDRPVEQISWDDCQAFCAKLGQLTGKRFRLPTEAEWEYACRAGTTTPFHFGDTIGTDQANYDGNSTYGRGNKGTYRQQTTPVGSFPANAWGLFDMHGNVWEWCQDWYGPYSKEDIKDPQNINSGEARVLRGGSWCDDPLGCRSASRLRYAPGHRDHSAGCRVVLCLD
ncbi:MAG TPA: SUMF1/EgtB/PvdO family nonheme iron enzyme [Gemmataceae bacterium]|nr:SUMF1/EgtB/PvdO family nonheme iron enzyme [Gemmataceae bacterium]